MAASAPVDLSGAFKITSLTGGVVNVNTNSGAGPFDMSPYQGTLAVVVSCGNGVSGTALQPILKTGADTNISNANVTFATGTNFTNVNSSQTINVDLRATATSGANKYLYLTWLISGSATANSGIDAFVIGQQKYSS